MDANCLPAFIKSEKGENGLIKKWNADGMDDLDGFNVWIKQAKPRGDYLPIGDFANSKYNDQEWQFLLHKSVGKHPTDYKWVYDDKGSGADKDISVWKPIAPEGYVAVGHVASTWNRVKPPLTQMLCVPKCMVEEYTPHTTLWRSGGGDVGAHFRHVYGSNTFVQDWNGPYYRLKPEVTRLANLLSIGDAKMLTMNTPSATKLLNIMVDTIANKIDGETWCKDVENDSTCRKLMRDGCTSDLGTMNETACKEHCDKHHIECFTALQKLCKDKSDHPLCGCAKTEAQLEEYVNTRYKSLPAGNRAIIAMAPPKCWYKPCQSSEAWTKRKWEDPCSNNNIVTCIADIEQSMDDTKMSDSQVNTKVEQKCGVTDATPEEVEDAKKERENNEKKYRKRWDDDDDDSDDDDGDSNEIFGSKKNMIYILLAVFLLLMCCGAGLFLVML